MNEPTHVDLFTGLGGFAVAAGWAGFRTVAMCERDERCRAFLTRSHGLQPHPDIRSFDGRRYRGATLLTGGPPCQPSSRAGQQRGEDDDRWLWQETLRVLAEVEPDGFVLETPLGIIDLDFDGILFTLERIGYEVRTFDIPACAVDSPQIRQRYWVVGFRNVADAGSEPPRTGVERGANCSRSQNGHDPGRRDRGLADAEVEGHQGHERWSLGDESSGRQEQDRPVASCAQVGWQPCVWVPCEDGYVRRAPDESLDVVNGLHRSILAALGNSIVPQVAYQIILNMKPFLCVT